MDILIFTVCTCSGPPGISNGDFSPRQGTYNCGAFVDYSCNQGFSLQGSSRVTCNQNRQWGPAPTCQQGYTFEITIQITYKIKIRRGSLYVYIAIFIYLLQTCFIFLFSCISQIYVTFFSVHMQWSTEYYGWWLQSKTGYIQLWCFRGLLL